MRPSARQRSQPKYESPLDRSQQSDEEETGDSLWGPLTQAPSSLVDHHAADVNLVRMRLSASGSSYDTPTKQADSILNRLVNQFLNVIGAIHWAVEIRGTLYELRWTDYAASIEIHPNSRRSLAGRQVASWMRLGTTTCGNEEIAQISKSTYRTSKSLCALHTNGWMFCSSRLWEPSAYLRPHQCQLSAFCPRLLQANKDRI
jgi:hypothetical protein